ncbi:hypothetical protein ACJMK2_035897 [Sinanodonta woodiana]|uniref:Amine oxidase n=1 Tax=Sinanodonta woodiana TaxID=1069815 RepID=A0ABD3WFG8_SINWO
MHLKFHLLAMYSLLMLVYCKENNTNTYLSKEVVVIGGGLSGLVAARELMKNTNYSVRVLEGRKDRYGGRVWTNRKSLPRARGVEAELGAMVINSIACKDTPIMEMIAEFELQTNSTGDMKIYLPDKNLHLEGEQVHEMYSEVLNVLHNAVDKVKSSKKDISVRKAVEMELENFKSKIDKEILLDVLNTLPNIIFEDFSAAVYKPENELGWDTVILDGQDTFLDRIVAGSEGELPLKIELGKVVQQVKVDPKRQKVIIRIKDGTQRYADGVIVALPIGVLKSKSVLFEPPLPKSWYQAISNIGLGYSNKIIIGFDTAFWPVDTGSFTVTSKTAKDGFLQLWTNLYKYVKKPLLVGNIFGTMATQFENMADDVIKEKALVILGQIFGNDLVRSHNVTVLIRSNWSTDPMIMGSVSYPKVGNSQLVWNTLKDPICPYIYFAGSHTESEGHIDSIHGAFKSGLRAASQLSSGLCKLRKQQENEAKLKTQKQKETEKDSKNEKFEKDKSKKKTKTVQKDEL